MAEPRDPDPSFEEWASEIEDLGQAVTYLVQKRADWWTLQQVFANNPTLPPSGLFDFIVSNYLESASVGVRRLVDTDNRTNSLMRLLLRIRDHPELLTRRRYIDTRGWITNIEDYESEQFDQFVGEPGHLHVPRQCIQDDIDHLKEASSLVKQYVDKQIAHMDKTPPDKLPTYGDLHDAIGEIETVFKRWYVFLRACDISVLPIQIYNWFAPLMVPWITDAKSIPIYGQRPPS